MRCSSINESSKDTKVEMTKRNRLARVEKLSTPEEDATGRYRRVSEVSSPGLPRLLMFHDSFGIELIYFLSEHFSNGRYLSQLEMREVYKLVNQEKPGIVIIEVVERYLDNLGLINP